MDGVRPPLDALAIRVDGPRWRCPNGHEGTNIAFNAHSTDYAWETPYCCLRCVFEALAKQFPVEKVEP